MNPKIWFVIHEFVCIIKNPQLFQNGERMRWKFIGSFIPVYVLEGQWYFQVNARKQPYSWYEILIIYNKAFWFNCVNEFGYLLFDLLYAGTIYFMLHFVLLSSILSFPCGAPKWPGAMAHRVVGGISGTGVHTVS